MPAILDGRHHRVVVERIARRTGKAKRIGNYERDDVTAARVRVATPAGVAEAFRAGASEIAFIPGDEDDGISGPCFRGHDRVDGTQQEGISGGD